jgi:hypothetical protein
MKIELKEIKIADIVNGYEDNGEKGIVGFCGKLNIRPPYQREFIYDDKKQIAVIDTINKQFPLNVMYWAKNDDGTFEVLDGQQRTLSFCKYVNGEFTFDFRFFHNLAQAEKDTILNYRLMIYVCEGNDKEKLDWFRVINIAGEKLTEQELLNATYTGSWLYDAKLKFSKTNCPAYLLAKDYVDGQCLRQAFLQMAIEWRSKGNIEVYMAKHQHDQNANELWLYFQSVINWTSLTFTTYRKEMKGVNWGELYDGFHTQDYDTAKLEKEIARLMIDDDITNKKGIYPFVLTSNEKYLNIRVFSESMKRETYERQNGKCAYASKGCVSPDGKTFNITEMEADHIIPWKDGGKTNAQNCQMLCKDCNRRKSGK